MSDTFRCIIKKEKGNFFIGEDYNGKKYNIEKNTNIRCKVGDDFYFYARRVKGFLRDTLIPISISLPLVRVGWIFVLM
ncbi:hypothetical protein [Clostridium sp.]|uniref:hypothetical protein n=1 Tax=Clostridium sp. TaxID=1506 RepID=UPI002901CA9E|nr:hypothetical protein [Clostridium sp.]MDU2285102.1 hypothetical protein [Clostridium sp.]